MIKIIRLAISAFLFSGLVNIFFAQTGGRMKISINGRGYYHLQGLDIMMFDDFYSEGHQGGLTIVQFGTRVAANGDVRIDPTPGQWSPVPKVGERTVDGKKGIIEVNLQYPDSSKEGKGFNPIIYPHL